MVGGIDEMITGEQIFGLQRLVNQCDRLTILDWGQGGLYFGNDTGAALLHKPRLGGFASRPQ